LTTADNDLANGSLYME